RGSPSSRAARPRRDCAPWWPARSTAPATCSRPRSRRWPPPTPACARPSAWPAPSTCACWSGSSASATTCSGGARSSTRSSSARPWPLPCVVDDGPGNQARGGAHVAGRRARRRARVRRVVRGALGGARARFVRGFGGGPGPLRDRRARHLGLRGADRVAGGDGRRGGDPPGDPVHALLHPVRVLPVPPAVVVVVVRLPDAVSVAVGAV